MRHMVPVAVVFYATKHFEYLHDNEHTIPHHDYLKVHLIICPPPSLRKVLP